MKKITFIIAMVIGILYGMEAQVTSLEYLMDYNDETNQYDCKIVIASGTATTIPQRIQFNAQYSIVVPTGIALSVTESYMPLQNNSMYTGTVPLSWAAGTPFISPPQQPESDFYSITPDLGITSHYNDLAAGDTITIFSFELDAEYDCAQEVRIFENGVDPELSMADLSNGFTLGSINQIYSGNAISDYNPNYISLNNALSICEGTCTNLEPKLFCFPESLSFEWSTGDTTEVIEVCPTEPSNYYLLVRDDDDNLLDSIYVFVDFNTLIDIPESTTVCAGSSITLISCEGNGTWSQAAENNFGATLNPLPGGVTEVTFSTFAEGGTYEFIFSLLGSSDSIQISVNPAPLIIIQDAQICAGEQTVVTSNIPGGTWVSNNISIATIDAITGVITGESSGVATITHTAPTGCTATSSALIVNPTPTISTTSESICINSSALLSPSTGGTWVALNSGIASLAGNIVTGESSGDAGFLFTTDAAGCVSDTLFIKVDSGPITNLTGPNQICYGTITTIEPSTGGTWSSTNTTIGSIDNFGNITGVGIGVVQFVFTNAVTGCSSDPSEPVQVTPAPIVSAPVTELCYTETMNLSPAFGGTWTSSDATVATVNSFTGFVVAVSPGTVTFTFTDAATGCSSTTDIVTVFNIPNVAFTAPDSICVGFTTTVVPSSGGTWVSSSPSIATLDNGGNVIGISEGTAELIFTETDSGCSSASLTVTVLESIPVSITGDDELCVGEISSLSPTTGGVWASNNTSVATVDNAGNVLAIGPGQTTFTFTTSAGLCTSKDTDPITVWGSETIVLGDTELCVGETTIASTTASGTWVSTTPGVATINANTGVTTAVSAGTTTIIFTNTSSTCLSIESEDLIVYSIPSVSITGPDEICPNETSQLFPSSGGVWTSSNPSIASVENNGLVIPIALGGPVTFTWTENSTGCTSNDSPPITVVQCSTTTSSCEDINPGDIYCDYSILDNVEGSLSSEDSEGNQPMGLLCDSEAGNIRWLGFVALEGDYDIVINTSSCFSLQIPGVSGVQVGMYSNCTFDESSLIFCDASNLSETEFIIPSDLLTAGEIYYVYIDGLGNSICDFNIDVNGSYDDTFCTDLSKVTGIAYKDDNENGVYDIGETPLRNVMISLFPGDFSVLTNDEGKYIINTPKGDATLSAKINEGDWINNELIIEDLSIFEDCVEGIDFGFVPNLLYQEAKVSVANTVTRCDWETRFYFTVENTGMMDINPNFEFVFDDKTTYFSTNLIGLQVNGEVASAQLGTIEPFAVREYWITLKMPSGSSVLPILDFKTTLYNEAGLELDVSEQSEQLKCSYDPNDKREFPNREGEENLTLMDEEIEYTIRFQNNGNDTAFQVKIVDPLDPNIEPTSIRVINSSHAVETCIENENLIFLFENINLVDSMTNYDGSQGYVSFRCNTKEGRAENTIVNNTADIIFDTNAPIITNTTINTLVSELCSNVTTEMDIEICDGDNYNGIEESGTYTEVFPLTFGCDSILIIHLGVQEITYSSQEVFVCEGEPFELNGEDYVFFESQQIRDSVINTLGCISNVFIYNIEVNPVLNIAIDTTICEGMEYNGLIETGIYTIDSFDVETGCDIITTIDLVVLPMNDPSCIVGIEDLEVSEIKLYPNPARESFQIESEFNIERIKIYSLDSKIVLDRKYLDLQISRTISVDDANFSKGLYIIEVNLNGRKVYKKLLIE